jgi:hypothetical protein
MRKTIKKPVTSSLDIDSIKSRVKSEIVSQDPSQQFDFLLLSIKADIETDQHLQLLEQFIKLVHLLLIDARSPRLSEREIRQVRERGYAILTLLNIRPLESRLSGLYGELHIALSRVAKCRGKHFTAAWEHQLALIQSRRDPVGDECFQLRGLAHRAERLGQLRIAKNYLAQLLTIPGDLTEHHRSAKLIMLRLARMQQNW